MGCDALRDAKLVCWDKVCVKNLPGESKLDRIWQVPCKVEKVNSSLRVVVNTPQGKEGF